MRKPTEDTGRESWTGAEPGRATPQAIAQVARILRRRWSARREKEGPAPPARRVDPTR